MGCRNYDYSAIRRAILDRRADAGIVAQGVGCLVRIVGKRRAGNRRQLNVSRGVGRLAADCQQVAAAARDLGVLDLAAPDFIRRHEVGRAGVFPRLKR